MDFFFTICESCKSPIDVKNRLLTDDPRHQLTQCPNCKYSFCEECSIPWYNGHDENKRLGSSEEDKLVYVANVILLIHNKIILLNSGPNQNKKSQKRTRSEIGIAPLIPLIISSIRQAFAHDSPNWTEFLEVNTKLQGHSVLFLIYYKLLYTITYQKATIDDTRKIIQTIQDLNPVPTPFDELLLPRYSKLGMVHYCINSLYLKYNCE